jgi:flavin reductase (DIM6/NTAB) family NADH-FMN oxidoreductase RutF
MRTYDRYTELVTAERQPRENYYTLASCVLPRPIALVSTISAQGVANLAPFSFFNGVCAHPPAVMFAPAADRTGKDKDTLNNLRQVGECVVNVVPHDIREAMNRTSYPYPPEINEFDEAGFTPLPSRLVRPPRAAQSPVQMECRLIEIVKVGQGPLSGSICVCEVLCFHIAEVVCLPNETADVAKIDLIGRLGGDGYSTIRDRFDLPRPAAPGE